MIRKFLRKLLHSFRRLLFGDTLERISQRVERLDRLQGEDYPLTQLELVVAEIDRFLKRTSVATILDVGSRDAEVAIMFKRFFPRSKVFAFECNPRAIDLCRENIKKSRRNDIVLVDKAVSDQAGTLDFHAVDPRKWGNIGASSLYAPTSYPAERFEKIKVEAVTLAEWARGAGVNAVDILWLDLQGAELKALQGMGALAQKVKFIYVEVEHKEMYVGQPLLPEIDSYLAALDFTLLRNIFTVKDGSYGTSLYISNQLLQ